MGSSLTHVTNLSQLGVQRFIQVVTACSQRSCIAPLSANCRESPSACRTISTSQCPQPAFRADSVSALVSGIPGRMKVFRSPCRISFFRRQKSCSALLWPERFLAVSRAQ